MSNDNNENVAQLPQQKQPKKPADILKQIENENKEKLAKSFKAEAQKIMDEINAARKTVALAEKKLAELIARYEEGIV